MWQFVTAYFSGKKRVLFHTNASLEGKDSKRKCDLVIHIPSILYSRARESSKPAGESAKQTPPRKIGSLPF